jgi:putative ABC transport system permease protein
VTFDTRWKKTLRDAVGYRGRALALFVALSAGVFTVSTMLGAYGIVSREITVNYARTNPASATIEVGEVTPSVLAAARRFPGIAVAGRGGRRSAGAGRRRVDAHAALRRDDFGGMRHPFTRDSGDWPPPAAAC